MNVNAGIKWFIDTNILIYAYDLSARDKHTLALHLMEQCWENGNGCVSIQVLQEYYVSVTRKIAVPLEIPVVRQIVADLTRWPCHVPGTNDLLQAIDLQQKYRISFWDAMILQSATSLGCEQLLSEDLNHGQKYGPVQVVNPFISL